MSQSKLTIENELEYVEIDYSTYFKQINTEIQSKKEIILKYTSQIDVNNITSIINFGEEPTKKLNAITDNVLRLLKKPDRASSDSFILKLQDLITFFDNTNETPVKSKKFLGFITLKENKKQASVDDFAKNIEMMYIEIKKYQELLLTEHKTFINMGTELKKYYEELLICIFALKNKIDEYQNASNSTTFGVIDRLKNKINTLEIVGANATMSLPQITLLQQNNFSLYEQIKNSFLVTLPTCKNCIVQIIEYNKQKASSETQQKLKTATIDVVEKNIQVTLNTMKNCMSTLKDGVSEVKALEIKNKLDSEKLITTILK